MTRHGIDIPVERIAGFCRENGISRLSLFGSVLREDFCDDSDVDVLVEFQPGVRVGYALIRMQDELTAMMGRPVDLNTPGGLSRYFRDEVLREAETLYVSAHRLVHGYDAVDHRILWDIVEQDFPMLSQQLKLLIPEHT